MEESLRCLPVSAHRVGFGEEQAAWVKGSGGRHGSDTLGRYHAGKMIQDVWRHAVGNVGPTVRSLILKYWQCGPAPQRPACSNEGWSLQTAAIAPFAVDARGPAALAAEAAAASSSAALIVILFNISRVPCWLRVGDVQVFERMVRMVTRRHTPFRANTRMHHGYRVHRVSVFPIRCRVAH